MPISCFPFALHLGPVHMIPGQLIARGQLTDPGLNFASAHGLTTPGNRHCRGNFSSCEQNPKVAPRQE